MTSKGKSSSVEARRRKQKLVIPVTLKNPFEVRIFRAKHEVLGKKVKTDKGLPGVSKSKAISKRKKTLLKEYKQRHKSNMLVDRRFGEYDVNISAEEKMLKRFTLEKQHHHERAGLYNLDDDEDVLTHYGQSLANIDNFDDAGLVLSGGEDDQEAVDNFSGFLHKKSRNLDERQEDQGSMQKRTRQEIMDEVVANSKKKKYERQMIQEQAFELTQKLDTQWKEIHSLLIKRDDKSSSAREQADDYDMAVKQLAFEAKAAASDRLKTEEEIAREEKEKLEKLEVDRQKRMRGSVGLSDGPVESADAIVECVKPRDRRFEIHYKNGKMVLPEGMELFPRKDDQGAGKSEDEGDGCDEDDQDEAEDVSCNDGETETDEGESETETDGGENENETETDEESTHEDVMSDEDACVDEDIGEDSQSLGGGHVTAPVKSAGQISASKELPFTFAAPASLDDLLSVMETRSQAEQLVILERIRKCYHIKLDAGNRSKLLKLFAVLIDYIDHLCDRPRPVLKLANELSSHLFELGLDLGVPACRIVREKLRKVAKTIMMRLKSKAGGGAFPVLKEHMFFKVISALYPTSDLEHAVTTPCLLLMILVMNKAHFSSIPDVVSGLLLLITLFDFVKLSRRYIPEVIGFLAKIMYLACDVSRPLSKMSASILNLRKSERDFLLISETLTEDSVQPVNICECFGACVSASLENNRLRLSCVNQLLVVTRKFADLYSDVPSYHEVFHPLALLLERLPTERYPSTVRELHSGLLMQLSGRSHELRLPLAFHARKPVPLPLLEPRFDEHYEVRPRRGTAGKAFNEKQKLKYKVRRETKSAIREIRKDASFLAKEQLKETLQRDTERMEKVKELQSYIAGDRGEMKRMDRVNRRR